MSKSSKNFVPSKETYTVTTIEENGEVIIPLPLPLLKKLGWKENERLEFNVDDKGRYIISKAKQ
jgi:bifunctional DNA-binding transcriptional regulator/antitoxin component of YhaV-PrlF toxin-antitoxin module